MSYNPTHKVDLNNIDAVRRHIWNATYLYAIPGYYRYSKEYNEKVGHLDTGSKLMNQQVMSEYVDVGGTIIDILKLYEQGADIKMRNGSDLVTIYETLTAHLRNWQHYVNNDPNVKDAPLSALYLMSDFCKTIHDQVKGFKPKVEDVPELRRISSLFGGIPGAEGLFGMPARDTTAEDAPSTMNQIEKLLAERNTKR